jgi:hypothetical protein
MVQGVEVYDASGNLTLSVTDRLTKLLGAVNVSSSGSLTLPAALAGNSYWFAFIPSTSGFTGTPPVISVSGTTLSWTYPAGATNLSGTVHYGMY